MITQSDTPLTDAAVFECENMQVVSATFAESLERQLGRAQAEIQRLEDVLVTANLGGFVNKWTWKARGN